MEENTTKVGWLSSTFPEEAGIKVSEMIKRIPSDPRQAKIDELKENIEQAGEDAQELRDKLKDMTDEEEKKKTRTTIQELLTVMSGLSEELRLTRMNKYTSSFFEWNATGLNRRQKRNILKQMNVRKRNARDNGNGIEDTTDHRNSD